MVVAADLSAREHHRSGLGDISRKPATGSWSAGRASGGKFSADELSGRTDVWQYEGYNRTLCTNSE